MAAYYREVNMVYHKECQGLYSLTTTLHLLPGNLPPGPHGVGWLPPFYRPNSVPFLHANALYKYCPVAEDLHRLFPP
jgi:hypothetical protein